MRINLVTPFAEKDAVKALGARWDSVKRIWYIKDVSDLTPFMRWIPNMEVAMGESITEIKRSPTTPSKVKVDHFQGITTLATVHVPHCGCNALPWEDCMHSAKA